MKYRFAISAVLFTCAFVALPMVWGDSHFNWRMLKESEHRSTGVAVMNNPLYKEECGSCHMAYPPGLLPSVSWKKIMSGLDDHFGDNAELDEQSHKSISQFLFSNSADQSAYRRSRNMLRDMPNDNVPIRISKFPYFLHEHHEIPNRMVVENSKVKSFSNCNACHLEAEQGLFNEHDIRIPGFGRWDD